MDDRLHARTHNHHQHIVVVGPPVEVSEPLIQQHVLLKNPNTLIPGGVHRVQHLLESVAETHGLVENLVVELLTPGVSHPQLIGQIVITVLVSISTVPARRRYTYLEGDGPIEIRKHYVICLVDLFQKITPSHSRPRKLISLHHSLFILLLENTFTLQGCEYSLPAYC